MVLKTHGNLSTGKVLSPPHLPLKPIVQSINKPMSSPNKPLNATPATKTHGDSFTGKDLAPPYLPPRPIMKSIHKPTSSANKPTATPATKTHGGPGKDPPPKPHIPPKPIMKPIHKRLLLRQRYALLDTTSREVVGEYQKPIFHHLSLLNMLAPSS